MTSKDKEDTDLRASTMPVFFSLQLDLLESRREVEKMMYKLVMVCHRRFPCAHISSSSWLLHVHTHLQRMSF
jgi:hypothetical protein